MKKVLKVKEYILASKGQFIPLEQSINPDGIVTIQKVERIKDGNIFIKQKDLVSAGWTAESGVRMHASTSILHFCKNFIHVVIVIFISDSERKVKDSFFEEMEINDLTPQRLHSITLERKNSFLK